MEEETETQLVKLRVPANINEEWKDLCDVKGYRDKYGKRLTELIEADIELLKVIKPSIKYNKAYIKGLAPVNTETGNKEVVYYIRVSVYQKWLKELTRLKLLPGRRAGKLMEEDIPVLEDKSLEIPEEDTGKCKIYHVLPIAFVEPWRKLCKDNGMTASGRLNKLIITNIDQLDTLEKLELVPIADMGDKKTYTFTVDRGEYKKWGIAMDQHRVGFAEGIANLIIKDIDLLKRLKRLI